MHAITFGVDCLSLVRAPEEGREAGICVVMFDDRGIRRVGRIVERHARRLPGVAGKPQKTVGLMDFDSSLRVMFELMEAEKLPWIWVPMEFLGKQILVSAFLGTKICEPLAKELTAVGCPTSLK